MSSGAILNTVPTVEESLNQYRNELQYLVNEVDDSIREGDFHILHWFFPVITSYKDSLIRIRDTPGISGEDKTTAINLLDSNLQLRDRIDDVLREHEVSNRVDGGKRTKNKRKRSKISKRNTKSKKSKKRKSRRKM